MSKPRYKGVVICPHCHSGYIPDRYIRRNKKTGEEREIDAHHFCPWCCNPKEEGKEEK